MIEFTPGPKELLRMSGVSNIEEDCGLHMWLVPHSPTELNALGRSIVKIDTVTSSKSNLTPRSRKYTVLISSLARSFHRVCPRTTFITRASALIPHSRTSDISLLSLEKTHCLKYQRVHFRPLFTIISVSGLIPYVQHVCGQSKLSLRPSVTIKIK